MDSRAWHYFLTLEQEFLRTAAFVEPHPNNYATFSDRYAGLLLLVGSEIDVVAKALSRRIDPAARHWSLGDCCTVITARYPELHTVEIAVPRYDLAFRPWRAWGDNPPTKASWWDDYNAVKHDRIESRERASLAATLESLCGLLVLNLYYNADVAFPNPFPELLEYAFPSYLYSERLARRPPGLEPAPAE